MIKDLYHFRSDEHHQLESFCQDGRTDGQSVRFHHHPEDREPFESGKWDAVRYEIVKSGNRAKFEQNPELKAALLKTGNRILAEASPKDTIWGIGLGREAAIQTDPQNWPGQNLMGKILTELREEFRDGKTV